MAKEYPIQNVSFRGETDNFLTEAGGGSELPKWVNDIAIPVNAERVYDLPASLLLNIQIQYNSFLRRK